MTANIEIINAEYIDGRTLLITFNTGEKRRFDFTPIINIYPAFAPLKEDNIFKNFKITDTLEWDNGRIDIAPEYILNNGTIA